MRGKAALLVVFAMSCTSRALDVPADGGPDLARSDLATVFDFAGTDMVFDMATPPVNPCPAGARFIFTIDQSGMLSRFNPANAQFFDVAPITCPLGDPNNTPNSMAIDREGNGYVNYQEGQLYRLLTANAECQSIPYTPGQFGILSYGMSFAESSPASTDETLWVAPTNSSTPELASIDLTTYQVSNPIQLSTTDNNNAELTGDDEANLWGFFPGATLPFIARINKTTGKLDRRINLPALTGQPAAWGFAAWNGDFYVFLQRSGEPSTTVYHVDSATGAVDPAVSSTGRIIVGVGAATCAGSGLDQ